MGQVYLSDEFVRFGGIEIALWRTTPEHDNFFDFIDDPAPRFMQKDRHLVEFYMKMRERLGQAGNLLEVGLLHGASSIFWHQLFQPSRMVCVDLFGPKLTLEKYRNEWCLGVIRPHYGVDQADKRALTEILDREFDGPIDFMIDDASHLYGPTRATFETVFPRMRPGGVYVIEDWQHWGKLEDRPALTDFIAELIVELGFGRDIIRDIGFGPSLAWIERGGAPIPEDWSPPRTKLSRPRQKKAA